MAVIVSLKVEPSVSQSFDGKLEVSFTISAQETCFLDIEQTNEEKIASKIRDLKIPTGEKPIIYSAFLHNHQRVHFTASTNFDTDGDRTCTFRATRGATQIERVLTQDEGSGDIEFAVSLAPVVNTDKHLLNDK